MHAACLLAMWQSFTGPHATPLILCTALCQITNVDLSRVVIDQMQELYSDAYPEMAWHQARGAPERPFTCREGGGVAPKLGRVTRSVASFLKHLKQSNPTVLLCLLVCPQRLMSQLRAPFTSAFVHLPFVLDSCGPAELL